MAYQHMLDPETGLQPGFFDCLGWRWSSATGSETTAGMDWCFQADEAAGKLRFEVRNTPQDNGPADPDDKRRAEISTVEEPGHQAHNGEEVWNAYLYRMQPWQDREAMAAEIGSTAICISQLKPNSGGSPTRAHRVQKDAYFRATITRPGSDNDKIYTGMVRQDDGKDHSIVERLVCDPEAGEWDLWLDGEQIVEYRGPMGAGTDGYSPSLGIYAACGCSETMVCEYAEIELLSAESLFDRVDFPPTWPADEGGGVEPPPVDPDAKPEHPIAMPPPTPEHPIVEPPEETAPPESGSGTITCPNCGQTGTIDWDASVLSWEETRP